MHRLSLAILALAIGAAALASADAPVRAEAGPSRRYIVVLQPGQAPAAVAGGHNLALGRSYSRVFSGFSAELTDAEAERLRADPRVRGVAPDHAVQVAGAAATLPGATPGLPKGVDRIDAELSPPHKTVGLAVLDSGIDTGRPEFNLRDARSFVAGLSPEDEFGHGTHVAGIATARVMATGFRGVARGSPLWSLRVVGPAGMGTEVDLVAAIDWLTANGPGLGIRVANISLITAGSSSANCGQSGQTIVDPLHYAICQSTQAGIVYVASAANQGIVVANPPAVYPEVLAVSNVQDNDGRGDALGGAGDDVFHTTSNFGAPVDLAAPGMTILSTVPPGGCTFCSPTGYATLTGTSQAAPHVAGALATYIMRNPGVSTTGAPGALSPAALALIAQAKPQSGACGYSGDPDATHEPFAYVGIPDSTCGAVALTDSDGDGLPDGVEAVYGTNPNAADTDADTCLDRKEVEHYLPMNPLDARDFTDANDDGKVSFADLIILAGTYGKTSSSPGWDPRADFDLNGAAGFSDLLLLAAVYTTSCP